MSILCIGSINIDHVYRVNRHPGPGETLPDDSYAVHLGGKGANMSLAAAAAGAQVNHVGAIGSEGTWCRDQLSAAGVGVWGIADTDAVTGHAVVMVDQSGENVILIHAGANRALTEAQISAAIGRAAPGDWLLLQNETNLVAHAAQTARASGLKVAYAAAPFDASATAEVLPHTDLLAVNEVEAAQLARSMQTKPEALPVPAILVTHGSEGATYRDGSVDLKAPAFPVKPVDTTGAGDTFLGYFLAGLDAGDGPAAALRRASAAAAIQITRVGAADAIPLGSEVDKFLDAQT